MIIHLILVLVGVYLFNSGAIMNNEEFIKKILSILPNASFDVDNYGQIIIYTNKEFRGKDLVEFNSKRGEDDIPF